MDQMVVDNFSEIQINLDFNEEFKNDTTNNTTRNSTNVIVDTDNNSNNSITAKKQKTNKDVKRETDELPEIKF